MKSIPVVYMIFDVLYLDGRARVDLPYEERRKLLMDLGLDGSHWRTPANHIGDGEAMVNASREQDLEGIIAKRIDSRYEPGERSGAWLKVKLQRRHAFLIGGWVPSEAGLTGNLGALVIERTGIGCCCIELVLLQRRSLRPSSAAYGRERRSRPGGW